MTGGGIVVNPRRGASPPERGRDTDCGTPRVEAPRPGTAELGTRPGLEHGAIT